MPYQMTNMAKTTVNMGNRLRIKTGSAFQRSKNTRAAGTKNLRQNEYFKNNERFVAFD